MGKIRWFQKGRHWILLDMFEAPVWWPGQLARQDWGWSQNEGSGLTRSRELFLVVHGWLWFQGRWTGYLRQGTQNKECPNSKEIKYVGAGQRERGREEAVLGDPESGSPQKPWEKSQSHQRKCLYARLFFCCCDSMLDNNNFRTKWSS